MTRSVSWAWVDDVHRGILIRKSMTVSRPIEEVYAFWKNFENFPKFMKHLEKVEVVDSHRSHWVARGPMGMTVEWDAAIYNEKPNELIAWRSLPDSQIDHTGSVQFRKAPADRGTEVHVELNYKPARRPARRGDRLALRRGAQGSRWKTTWPASSK